MRGADTVRVAADQDNQQVLQLIRTKLRVRILHNDGQTPFANRELTVGFGQAMFFAVVAKTDAEGWLLLDPAPQGEVRLEAWPPDINSQGARLKLMQHPEDWSKARTELAPIRVPQGKKELRVEVRLPAGFK